MCYRPHYAAQMSGIRLDAAGTTASELESVSECYSIVDFPT